MLKHCFRLRVQLSISYVAQNDIILCSKNAVSSTYHMAHAILYVESTVTA